MDAESPRRKNVKMTVESDSAPGLVTVDRDGDLILEVSYTVPKEGSVTSKTDSATESTSGDQPQKEDASAEEDSIDEGRATSAAGSSDEQLGDSDDEVQTKSKVSCLRIRVSAKALTLASVVFNVMLNGNFAEAQLKLNRAEPPTVALPDDDPIAMLSLCLIVHYAPGIHKFIEDYVLLHNIVVLCDKYACVDALRGWFRGQMGRLMLGFKFDSELLAVYGMTPERILKLTYLMDDYSLFALATATLIFHVIPINISEVLHRGFGEDVPDGLADMMKAFQYKHIKEFAAIGPALLEELATWADPKEEDFGTCVARIPGRTVLVARRRLARVAGLSGNPKLNDMPLCHCRAMRMGVLSGALTSMRLWLVQDEYIDNARSPKMILDNWKRVADVCFQDEAQRCPRNSSCNAIANPNLNDRLNRHIEDMVCRMDVGLCLGCLREIGGIGDPRRHVTGVCRNPKHDQDKKGAAAGSGINW